MFLAVGLGPAGYALGILHLLAHGFFKAGLFLGAGSVMHAMNDDVDMRHYGGLRQLHADHVRHVRARLPGADRLPVPVRLLLQGRDHRGRVRAAGLAGLGVRRAGHAGRRADRVLHDPADAHDVLRRAALEGADSPRTAQRLPPARVAGGDDGADDRAGGRLGRSPAACSPSGELLAHWLAPSLGELEELEGGALPARGGARSLVVAISALGVADRLPDRRAAPDPGAAARAGVAAGARPPAATSTPTRSTRRSSPGPASG